jgi:hypothetical protein
MSNIIICVKKPTNNTTSEILPGYIKIEKEYEKENVCCWNCCHNCDSIKYHPLKYKSGIFYVNGFFCSDECSLRYIYDTYKNKELWEKYYLLKFYHRSVYGEFIDINVIPNRLSLKIFGGELERDEYIGNNNNDELIIPPIIIVNNNPINKNTKNNSEYLKLFRKKKNKNTIIDSLE